MSKSGIIGRRISEFCSLFKGYGFCPAFYTFIWWCNFYIRSPFRFWLSKWALVHKTEWLNLRLSEKYVEIINKYKDRDLDQHIIHNPTIWVFWGQGEDRMPILVKSCFNQLKKHNSNVQLVTISNMANFVDIPDEVINKVFSGQITWAHFSDVVRMGLLSKNGGLWIDATVWVPDRIPFEKLIDMPLYSANGKVGKSSNDICFWTSLRYNWSGWCMWVNHTNSRLCSFVYEMLTQMAITEKMTLDYVLIDYLIYYAIENFSDVNEMFRKIRQFPTQNRGALASLMSKEYDEKIYNKLCKTDIFFKLSYRSDWKERTPEGKLTFYGKLIANAS